jgi:hypothetical protein
LTAGLRKSGSTGKAKRPIFHYLLLAAGTLLLLWLSLAVSIAGAFREFGPEAALRFWPIDGFAKATLAERVLAGGVNRANIDRARELALHGLNSEPTSARAARMLALLSEADRETARRRFRYARQLSRRDLPTTLWLIEDAVQQNNVPLALRQYDIALRTSRAAPPILFPILDAALTDRSLRLPIADLLATGQPWVPEFVEYSLATGQRTGPLALTLAARPRALQDLPLELKRRLIASLIDHQQFDLATRLYGVVGRRPVNPAEPVRAGGFEGIGEWPPLDWSVTPSGDYGASILEGEGLLQVYSQAGATGTVARQLVLLPAGRYDLLVRGAVAPENRSGAASVAVICADGTRPALASARVQAGSPGVTTRPFTVAPATCRYFWINVEVGSEGEGARFEASLDEIAIRRLPGA